MNISSSLVARPEYWPLGMGHGRVILRSAMLADTSRNGATPAHAIHAASVNQVNYKASGLIFIPTIPVL